MSTRGAAPGSPVGKAPPPMLPANTPKNAIPMPLPVQAPPPPKSGTSAPLSQIPRRPDRLPPTSPSIVSTLNLDAKQQKKKAERRPTEPDEEPEIAEVPGVSSSSSELINAEASDTARAKSSRRIRWNAYSECVWTQSSTYAFRDQSGKHRSDCVVEKPSGGESQRIQDVGKDNSTLG